MAKVWRWELVGRTTTLGLNWMLTQHYQTDLGIDPLEPIASSILEEIEEHYSLTGRNLQLFTNTMRADNVLTASRVREEVDPNSDDVPLFAERTISLPGTIGAMTGDKLPIEACVWVRHNTGVAGRSARGGFHLPPVLDPAHLDSNGNWSTSLLDSADMNALEVAIPDRLDNVIGDVDLVPIVYSRTRRARGQSPFTFDLTGAVFSSKVRWIRRRGQAP